MKFKYCLILLMVLVYSSNLIAQNTLNNISLTSSTPASVAYSLRLLSSSYAGPLVRIKVGTLFYDVYPDASNKFSLSSKISASISTYNAAVSVASTNALSTIITGSTNATVAIWYDQSGNSIHVLSSSPTATIITAGTINTLYGQPTVYFSGSTSLLTSSSTVDYSALSGATVNAVAQNVATTSSFAGIIGAAYALGNPGYNIAYDATIGKGYASDGAGCTYGTSISSTNLQIVTNIFTNTTTNLSNTYINGVLKTSSGSTCSLTHTSGSKIYIGSARGYGPASFIGNISEAIIFPKQLADAERNPLESNQTQTYFSPSVTITSSASGAVCAGTSITFTANAYNFTSTPTFQWYKNSTAITGATSSTYSTTSLNNSDIIYATAAPSVVTASLVTSNLMTNLDAGNSSSYGGTGTTWTDLTGLGNKATLTGTGYSSVNGGGITFTTSKYATQTLTSPPFNGDFTWSTILKAPDYNTNSWDFLYNVGGYTGLNIALVTGQPHVSWGIWFSDNINVSGLAQMVIGNYYMVTFVRSGNTVSFYLQASPYGTSGTVSATIPVAAPLIAKGPGGEWWENGIMNVMLLYNRALSQTEITQNYNSYATRFGLAAAGVTSNSISTAVDPATPIITVNGDACFNKSILTTTSGLTSYVWYKDNVAVSGAISNSFTPTGSGVYKVEVSNGICSNTSTITTLYDCGINSSGKAIVISNVSTLISSEGGANLGTAKDLTGKMFNTTSLTTLSAATIGTTSAILGGVISATNGRTASIGVTYSTDINFGTSNSTTITSNIAAGTYTATITGLSSSTTYFAKSFIVNASGTNYGPVVNFTTASPPPPASFSFSNSNLSGNMPNYYLATNNLTLSQLPTSWTIQWTHRTDESTGSGGADGMLWFFRNPSTTGKYSTDMHLYQINGSLQFWYNTSYTNTDAIMTGLTQGTIYKLALTYDGTNLRTYSNGSLISTKAINITVKPSNSTLVMGSNVARTLDEFRIWNSALSQAQIAANQDISVAGSTGLMLYYNFNDGTAGANNTGITSIADQSGNNRNGVFTNTALTGTVNNFVTPIVTGF